MVLYSSSLWPAVHQLGVLYLLGWCPGLEIMVAMLLTRKSLVKDIACYRIVTDRQLDGEWAECQKGQTPTPSSATLLRNWKACPFSSWSGLMASLLYLSPNLEVLVLFSPPSSHPPDRVSCQIFLLLILKHHLILSLSRILCYLLKIGLHHLFSGLLL